MPDYQETILKLLGHIAFKPEDIVKIVTFKKGGKSAAYIKGYNACNGTNSLKQIAAIIGVTSGTLSPILKQWEDEGIVYKTGEDRYKKLFSVQMKTNAKQE